MEEVAGGHDREFGIGIESNMGWVVVTGESWGGWGSRERRDGWAEHHMRLISGLLPQA